MTSINDSVLITTSELVAYRGPDLYLFVGISTAGSSVHRVFPAWAPLVAPGSVLRGVDLPEDAEPDQFLRLAVAMRDNPCVQGAVITSHKLRMYRAIVDVLDHVDPLVGITYEINSLDTRGGRIAGYARDAQSLDVILDTTGVAEAQPERPVVCIGAGGSAIALMLAMGLDIRETMLSGQAVVRQGTRVRGRLTILGRRQEALDEIAEVAERAGLGEMKLRLILASGAEQIAHEVSQTPPSGIIANATGLGKLGPGSPLASAGAFPEGTLAWDFNYRGPLTFLEQARAATVPTEDGWDYFVAGWAAALAAITGANLTDELFREFRAASVLQ